MSYLLRNRTACVVRGNPEITQWVIDQSPSGWRQRFVSCVVNDLTLLDSAHDDVLLDELELMCLAGRPKSAMPWCVIEHIDKGKREFHSVIPLFDLLFGKFVPPYVDRLDRIAFQAWVEYFALRYNLDFPHEKLRVKPVFEHLSLQKTDREFLEMIWNLVHGWVSDGLVNCRADLHAQIAKHGYSIRCDKYTGGPLQQPEIVGPNGKLRLTNSIYYHPDFGAKDMKPLDRGNEEAVAARLKELERVLSEWQVFRAFHSIGRFFGKERQKGFAKKQAKMRLKLLINERLAVETRVGRLVERIDFSGVFRSAHFEESVLASGILTPETKTVSMPKPVEMDDKLAPPSGGSESVAPLGKVVDTEISVAEEKAGSEAFQPPDSGGNQPSAIAAEAAVEPVKSTGRKQPLEFQNPSGLEDI